MRLIINSKINSKIKCTNVGKILLFFINETSHGGVDGRTHSLTLSSSDPSSILALVNRLSADESRVELVAAKHGFTV